MRWQISIILIAAIALAACQRRATIQPVLPSAAGADAPGQSTPLDAGTDLADAAQAANPEAVAYKSLNLAQTAGFSLSPQPGSPQRLPNFVVTDNKCKSSGLGGQIFTSSGQPISGLLVEVSGTLAGNRIFGLSISGSRREIGPGGYYIQLPDQPIPEAAFVDVRLLDLKGNVLSPWASVRIGADCQSNLSVMNFTELKTHTLFYMPVIYVNHQLQQYLPSITK